MANVTHASLTGSDLHEPKGCATASNGAVYVANGTGSGVWTPASSVITNAAWSTGDTKMTFQTSAPTGWVLHTENGTIGDGSSGGTIRANTDTSALFTLFWTVFDNSTCPVSGGRGASAAADFAAHKALTVPRMASRLLGVAGTVGGSGLTQRNLGTGVGQETTTLAANQIPTITSTVTQTITVTTAGGGFNLAQVNGGVTGINNGGSGGSFVIPGSSISNTWSGTTSLSGSNTISPTYTNSSQVAVSTMSPAFFMYLLIKL